MRLLNLEPCYTVAYIPSSYDMAEAFVGTIRWGSLLFESAGGMPRNIRFDNLAPCVRKVLKGDERIYTDRFKKAIDYYGFGTLPCSPGKGNEKGDVEREIRIQARRIMAAVKATGKVFHDHDDLNSWLLQHAEKYRSVATRNLLDEERQKMKMLPLVRLTFFVMWKL